MATGLNHSPVLQLGVYLKDRREKLDPARLGLAGPRRRTPGLRREEVATRAQISATWYTWLEQGRGGAPSAEVLERIAGALLLDDVEREHLFLLGLGRPPEVRYREGAGATPRLQRVLDALPLSPAVARTATWDVVAWNRAAAAMLTDYAALPPEQRNILRLLFLDPRVRAAQADWDSLARAVVATFRADVTRAGAAAHAAALVDELRSRSPDFDTLWRGSDVRGFGQGLKQLRHPTAGMVSFEYSSFFVDGQPELGVVVFNPATPADAEKVRAVLAASGGP